MVGIFIIAATSAAVLAVPLTALAQQGRFGTADEAKAMLLRVIVAVKADKTKALDMFNKGEGGFLDRDLVPFCFNLSDGKHVATQAKQLLGQDVRILKDSTGKSFGEEHYKAAQKPEGQITEVSYLFPRVAVYASCHRRCEYTRSGFRRVDDLVFGGDGVVDRHPDHGEVLLDHEARLLGGFKGRERCLRLAVHLKEESRVFRPSLRNHFLRRLF